MSQHRKILVGAGAIVLVAGLALSQTLRTPPSDNNLPFSSFLQKVEHAPEELRPHTLQILGGEGERVELRGKVGKSGTTAVPFSTVGYVSDRTLRLLASANIPFEIVTPPAGGSWLRIVATVVPALVILPIVFLLVLRHLQPGNGLMRFRDSKAKLLTESQRKVTFADVAGIDEAREELGEIVAFLANPSRFTRLGGRIPKGVLMTGSPGTGKTLLARAIAGEAGVPFFSISGSDFVEMFVGVGASRVRSLFEEGKRSAPCIIFIDEIDAVGRRRGTGLGGGHDEREQTLNQLLVEMDGFETNDGVILMAATNRPDVLDPALLRPGRFDRRIIVPQPDVKGREGILAVHTRKTPLAPDVDLSVVARGTPGFVGADLANLVNEAALLAARGDKDRLDMHDFEMARDKVLMGPERRSLVFNAKDKRFVAYHEAGHALVGKMLPGSDPIHKVTIIPRGAALGLTQRLPTEDRLTISRETAADQIAFAMGGRVAEEIVFGQITTGAANDLKVASDLARSMVCEWGMSERFGPIALQRPQATVFLGGDLGEARGHSQHTAAAIDDEVRRIVFANHDRARQIVLDHRRELTLIAEALLELETIDGGELDLLLTGKKIDRLLVPPVRRARPDVASAATDGDGLLLPDPLPVR